MICEYSNTDTSARALIRTHFAVRDREASQSSRPFTFITCRQDARSLVCTTWPSILSRVVRSLEGVSLTAVEGHVLNLVQNFSVVAHIVRERGRFGGMLSSCQLLLRAI